MKKLTIIIFGATGNLYADKLARALFLLFEQGTLPSDFRIIAFARKPITTQNFQTLSKEYILKKHQTTTEKVDEFIAHIEYFQGDFLSENDFLKLKNSFSFVENELVVFHVATAPFSYRKIFENMQYAALHKIGGESRIMIEKPFGENKEDVVELENVLSNIFPEKSIFHIDHYLAKETARSITEFRFDDGSPHKEWNNKNISKIKIIFHESNVVGLRGASYDKVGAFRDVGENHMLELLALLIMEKPEGMDASNIRALRAEALENLYIDYEKPITKGQYDTYVSEVGVDINSKTETFFRFFLASKNPRLKGVDFELEGGKGLVDQGSDITTTTVSAIVYFKNGEKKEFKIQPVLGTSYDSYVKVYTDVVGGDPTLFVSVSEILAQLKLKEELSIKWKDIPLVIYKVGTRPEDI